MAARRRGTNPHPEVQVAPLSLPPAAVTALRESLPRVGSEAVVAIRAEVPTYSGAMSGTMAQGIQFGVAVSINSFLDVAFGADGAHASLARALDGAFDLGRGEARSNRSVEAILAAYRVGSRRAWQLLAQVALENEVGAADIATLADIVFTYTDELQSATASGHAAELAASDRMRQQRLDELARALITGAPTDAVDAALDGLSWSPPEELFVALLPAAQLAAVLGRLDADALHTTDEETAIVLANGAASSRSRTHAVLAEHDAVVGQAVRWREVADSYRRAVRLHALLADGVVIPGPGTLTTSEANLAALVVHADPGALHDLRARVLAPLDAVRASSRDRLLETLRAWLLFQGRRDAVAAAVFVHPQTVRYRVGQLRELFGERLDDPDYVRDLVIALA